jgi:hypothetical protein
MITDVALILARQSRGLPNYSMVLIVLIVLLVAYILFLHYQLKKKDLLLDSLHHEFTGDEKSTGRKIQSHTRSATRDVPEMDPQVPDSMERLKKCIADDIGSSIIYIHYTNSRFIADRIVEEGFRFTESFHKTAEQISKDLKDLEYKHQVRKYFGNYIVIIAIRKEIFRSYEKELDLFDTQSLSIEHLLSNKLSGDGSDEDRYLLPRNFIKGYFDFQAGEFIMNPDFNPARDAKLPEGNSPGRHA